MSSLETSSILGLTVLPTPQHPHDKTRLHHFKASSASREKEHVTSSTFSTEFIKLIIKLQPNGAGKTSAIHMLNGLQEPTSGTPLPLRMLLLDYPSAYSNPFIKSPIYTTVPRYCRRNGKNKRDRKQSNGCSCTSLSPSLGKSGCVCAQGCSIDPSFVLLPWNCLCQVVCFLRPF